MPRRQVIESYRRYQDYLHQSELWPSESAGELYKIAEMVPRYAASAHAKLLRWADSMMAKAALNISGDNDRVDYVRGTPLARALARAAQSLPPLQSVPDPVTEVTPRDMILLFAPVIAEHTDLDITQIFKLAEALATKADEEWTTTIQSR